MRRARHLLCLSLALLFLFLFAFCSYIHHTRPDPGPHTKANLSFPHSRRPYLNGDTREALNICSRKEVQSSHFPAQMAFRGDEEGPLSCIFMRHSVLLFDVEGRNSRNH